GDGPYVPTMRQDLDGLPVHFTGYQDDQQLARLYASSDLLIFPSRTDTLGQVVMEAQACGLPAIVSAEGGPKESIADNVSGVIVSSNDAADWADVINQLLSDEPRRLRMSLAAVARAARYDLAASFKQFWTDHVAAAEPEEAELPARN